MLSDVGWLNVLSIMGILIFGCVFGLFFMYKGRKTKVKLLFFMGVSIFFNGLWYWGNFWESLSILTTGQNFDHITGISIPYEVQAIMSFIWVFPSTFFAWYVAAELILPKQKWYIVSFSLILGIIWELLLFLDPLGSLSIYRPSVPNSDLVDEDFIPNSPLSLIGTIFIIFGLVFMGFGYFYKSIKSKGVLKKKYRFLSAAFILVTLLGTLEGFGAVGITLFFSRAGIILSFLFNYFGLREESIKVEKITTEKDIKVEDSLFRIAKRPARITEEEVTYYREQKICLVCKGKAGGFNTYICTGCDALYHEDCARALSGMENACWACNEPIDKSKPSKPFKVEEPEVSFKKPEKTNEK